MAIQIKPPLFFAFAQRVLTTVFMVVLTLIFLSITSLLVLIRLMILAGISGCKLEHYNFLSIPSLLDFLDELNEPKKATRMPNPPNPKGIYTKMIRNVDLS